MDADVTGDLSNRAAAVKTKATTAPCTPAYMSGVSNPFLAPENGQLSGATKGTDVTIQNVPHQNEFFSHPDATYRD